MDEVKMPGQKLSEVLTACQMGLLSWHELDATGRAILAQAEALAAERLKCPDEAGIWVHHNQAFLILKSITSIRKQGKGAWTVFLRDDGSVTLGDLDTRAIVTALGGHWPKPVESGMASAQHATSHVVSS